MTMKLLDYRRVKKPPVSRVASLSPPPSPPIGPEPPTRSDKTIEQPSFQTKCSGPLDYPTITRWLTHCEYDFERGRDKHPYTSLSEMFQDNGCTRIDDVARLNPDAIRTMADAKGIVTSVGLINRICAYALEDVATVQRDGKINLN